MMKHLNRLLSRLKNVSQQGNHYQACCPAHDDADSSLSIYLGWNGHIHLQCRSAKCKPAQILAALELSPADLHADPNEDVIPIVQTQNPSNDQIGGDEPRDRLDELQQQMNKAMELTPAQQKFFSALGCEKFAFVYHLRENGITACLSKDDESVRLKLLDHVPSDIWLENAGKVLDVICKTADRAGAPLSTSAETEQSETFKADFVAWYEDYGFEGDWNDMTRYPSKIAE